MQFRSLNNANVGNYIGAGKAATQGFLDISGAIKKNSTDFTGIINQIQSNRGKAAREQIKGVGRVLSQVAQSDADVYVTDINERLKAEKALRNYKGKMAGALAASGSQAFKNYFELTRKSIPKPPPTKIVAPVMPDMSEVGTLIQTQLAAQDQHFGTSPTTAAPTTAVPPNVAPAGASSAVPPQASYSGIPTSGGLTSGQPQVLLPQSEYYNAVLRAGGTPDEARVLSAIVGPESNFYADNDTVKSGVVNTAGEVSVGPWQINMTPGPLRTERMQQYGITDLSQLYDPDTSARIALDLARTPTGYHHWSAYNDGLHTPYLGGHI